MTAQDCKTRYPLLLAHGLGVTEQGGLYVPWGRIPDALRAHGAQVFFGGQDAWGSIEDGAARLADMVRRIRRETGSARVNIIAHSKGGLEARHLISAMGYGRYVASLSMLSTPNRGSRVAEWLLRIQPGITVWAHGNDAWWRRHGDAAPVTLRAGRQLTPDYLAGFNRTHPDAACVYYQSWGARLGSSPDVSMRLSHHLFYPAHGDSDGLVTPASARWGRYRGTLENVGHQQLVDAAGRDVGAFDVRAFYIRLVRELTEMGF
nr:hypothetical protein [uncultured Agathobaculum sp.]